MNKRDFVLGGCTTLAASVVLPSPAMAGPASLARVMDRLGRFPDLQLSTSMDTWTKYIGERFVQTAPGAGVEMVLTQVDAHQIEQYGEQFTLTFAATAGHASLPLEAHHLRHGASGQQIPIFMQSAGIDRNGSSVYRADFNLIA